MTPLPKILKIEA